jgi:predicted nucleic acid-binding protein
VIRRRLIFFARNLVLHLKSVGSDFSSGGIRQSGSFHLIGTYLHLPRVWYKWLEVELQARFSGRILSIDAAVADRWGLLAAAAKIKGKPLSAIDGLLAATAIHHNLTIVSRNVGDFTNTQAPVVSPWDP